MPNLFSRRRGSSANPPIDRNTSAAAATAASSAFLARSASQTDLSSAAAAAALRSHTTTPEPVGNIQTKRMVRRGSQSAVGGGSVVGSGTRGGVGRGTLQRNNSSGSMSERTFRSPSPGRYNGAIPAAPEAPPVPALPASLRGGGHRRSASTEPAQRITSPTPPRGSRRGASVDRAGTSARTLPKINTVPEVDELERQGSAGSINYSRPISAQGHSPVATSKTMKSGGSWFTASEGTLSGKQTAQRPVAIVAGSQQDANNIQSDIASAANRPTKKKQIANNTQGSYLARANGAANSSADEREGTVMVYDPASRTFIAKPRQAAQEPEPPSPTIATPAAHVPKPGEYDPNTRKIVPEIPAQKPSVLVTGGDHTATRTKPALSVQPPPRHPTRTDPNGSPVSPRAAGLLQKQPSVVREDPEGEQEAETNGGVQPHKRQTNGFSGFSKTTMRPPPSAVTPAGSRHRSESLDVPRYGSNSSGRVRGNSHSPSRSARFSASPIMEVVHHDPPQRGVSPVKSAMKHSPSSSIRAYSPMATGGKAMSETSDTPSSVDGSARKKKSVRVSFTDQPPAAQPSFTSATRAAVARKVSPLIDDDMEEIMKPRPDLPSFGSVRQNRMHQEVAEKVTERPPDRRELSSDHAIGGILAQNASNAPVPPKVASKSGPSYSSSSSSSSSDESDDETTPASELDAGTASAKAVFSQVLGPEPKLDLQEQKTLSSDLEVSEPKLALQEEKALQSDIQISLQPPTPGEEDKTFAEAAEVARAESPPPRSSLEKFVVPGGWAAEPEEYVAPVAVDAPVSKAAPGVSTDKDKAKSIAERATSTPVSYSEPAIAHTPAEIQLSDIAESESDDSAVFSDAEEDLSYMDESGFASMDAIVESPVTKPKKRSSDPDSPLMRQTARRESKDETRPPVDDWSYATQYWKQLSKQQREQIERSHLSSDDEYRPEANSLANRPKKRKSALKQSTHVEPVVQPAKQAPAQPAKTSMRRSMRGLPEPAPAAAPPVQMRSSLREGRGGGMRTSMRERPQSEYMASKPAMKQNARPSSSGSALPVAAAGGAMSRHPQSPEEVSQDGPFPKMQPSASAKLAKKLPPPSVPANDSDSESSFRKKRRPSASDTGGRMRRSMRAGSIDSQQQRPASPTPVPTAKHRKAFSVRSLSPTGSFFGRKQLKESMRAAPADTGVRTLRGPNSMRNSSAKPSGKAAAAPRQRASTNTIAGKFKSRFADSDDEDDGGRGQRASFFRSRFADSDDDEPSGGIIRADLTPVRGIPRRQDQQDGDSTDLSDEDDYESRMNSRGRDKQTKPIVPDAADIEKAMAAARRNLGMTNGSAAAGTPPVNEGSALSKGSLRKAEPGRPQSPMDLPRKRSFMGSILRRNRTNSNASQQVPMYSPPPPLPTQAPLGSPRPGKLQRRTSAAQQDYFNNNNNPKTTRIEDDPNWPLAPPVRPGEIRPSTSDGTSTHEQAVRLARSMRPDIGRSQSNSEDVYPNGNHVGFAPDVKDTNGKANGYNSKTGKKKKFGMLRKAFGLDA